MDLEEAAGVHEAQEDRAHVHGDRRIGLREFLDPLVIVEDQRVTRPVRGVVGIVGREITQELAGDVERVAIIVGDEVDIAADAAVHRGTADLVHGDVAPGHRLDHLRPGDEELGVLPGHDDPVHQRRRISRAAGAGPGDHRDLRHDPERSTLRLNTRP
jgi:hypothetical protein